MKSFLRIGFCFLWLVFFPSRVPAQVRTIFLVRHADKVSDAYDSPLSDKGVERARCLADSLLDAHIEQIFVSDLQRTQQTAAPLAARLKLKPEVIPMTKPDDLVQAVESGRATSVLVVWHGGTLPKVLHALGGPEVAPISEAEYDRFFVLTLDRDAKHQDAGFAALRYCDCKK